MNYLKKQSTAWILTIVMIVSAIFLGRAHAQSTPTPDPAPVPSASQSAEDAYYVYDDAGVLTSKEIKALSKRNQTLMDDMKVVIACVTANYGKSDLYDYAMDYASKLELQQYDFIVVLDISGDNYWLIQGSGLTDVFTDSDCSDYAETYMERDFAAGRYGDALLSLTQALSDWYYANYNG